MVVDPFTCTSRHPLAPSTTISPSPNKKFVPDKTLASKKTRVTPLLPYPSKVPDRKTLDCRREVLAPVATFPFLEDLADIELLRRTFPLARQDPLLLRRRCSTLAKVPDRQTLDGRREVLRAEATSPGRPREDELLLWSNQWTLVKCLVMSRKLIMPISLKTIEKMENNCLQMSSREDSGVYPP